MVALFTGPDWARWPELEDDIEAILLNPAGGRDCRGEAIFVELKQL
jgi:hypothetical protein